MPLVCSAALVETGSWAVWTEKSAPLAKVLLSNLLKIRQSIIQYAWTLHWFVCTNEPASKCLMFQDLFFYNFLQNSLKKSYQFIFSSFHNSSKIKIKSLSALSL